MKIEDVFTRALQGDEISLEEAIFLYDNSPVPDLLSVANTIRFRKNPERRVSWQIDRNVNYTNVCISGCKFCNFHCTLSQRGLSYTTTIEEYRQKIDELISYGGDQLLLQGGLHPHYDITFYEELFTKIKEIYPFIKLNALGPPEVWHIARLSKLTIAQTLTRLRAAGLDSLPGAGAEILSDRVRKTLSPGKPGVKAWADVMECAHKMNISTTATMVYGHIETLSERMEHLILLRDIQSRKPAESPGFRAFICWPMQIKGTKLQMSDIVLKPTAVDHLKMVAISRILLNNIPHIQASWLTIGIESAKLALHCGADDMGSIMIEENVVSAAGASNRASAKMIERAITEAGFLPWLRNQDYTPRTV
ncbi:MAG: dehypoxanthine futalosine cyclase [Bacteroidetes bacterium HGW-Bacteroidetes-5]|jgi:cyclic dehypoxanthinyl futalosine synthase|nr:MAG: dehypoxanthine futalosine cyclase [Bacteroidetes bacterium HGW-Bacteroidetes-5]